MKKILLLISTFTIHLISYSQEENRTVTAPSHPRKEITTYTIDQLVELAKTVKIGNTGISPNTSASLPDKQSPALSAEANGVVRFKDVPVNLATGSMYLPIPIYTLSEGLLSVPVSLDYNGSGMKNQELASWCGVGWNLSAGGMITRMVKGIPDEGIKQGSSNYRGYYKFGFSGNGSSIEHDTEPDAFFLNINGSSYKFIYRHDGEFGKFEFFPDADIKVVPSFSFLSSNTTVGVFNSFKIIMPDGTQYFFGNGATETTAEAEAKFIQSSGNYPGTSAFTTFWKDNAQTSVWFLTKIVSVYGQEINFDYDHVQYSYYRISDSGVDGSLGVCPTPSQVEKSINRVFVSSSSLAKIRGVNTKIEINQRNKVCSTQYDASSGEYIEICEYQDLSNPRLDIDQWQRYPQSSSQAKKLIDIMVMENTTNPKDTLFYKFNYGYFTGAEDDLPTGYSTSDVGYSHQKRLRLEKIDFPDQTNVRFRYKGDSPTFNGKSRLNYGIDHWGYANGFTGNRFLTGLIPKDGDYPSCTPSTSNRESDSNFGFYGAMDSIIYSNRKHIAFEYEMHTAKNYKNSDNSLKPIGGLRIKSIFNKDLISGIETKKTYDYTANSQTSGHLALKPTYRYKTPFTEIGSHSSIYDRLLAEMGRPPIVYSRVTEKILNMSNQGLGKTAYYFDQDTANLSTYSYYVSCTGEYPDQVCDTTHYLRPEKVHASWITGPFDHKYNTGNLIKTETFNEEGDTLAINEWLYSTSPIIHNTTVGAKVFRVNNNNLGAYFTGSGYAFTEEYNQQFGKYRLESEVSTIYSQTGTNPIKSSTNYFYKDEMSSTYQNKYPGKHNQLVKTESTDSRGQVIEKYIKNPADFEFANDTIHYDQTCYDEYGAYDCSYDEYVPHIPQLGSQARGIFEFKDKNIWAVPIETLGKIDFLTTGASYLTIEAFPRSTTGFKYASKKAFSSGNIGYGFFEMEYHKTPNDTIYREQTYFENQKIEEYNDYGLPLKTKAFGGATASVNYDASKLLPNSNRFNIGGVVIDTIQTEYDKKLFGVSKQIGINKLQTVTVYDSTFKKGLVKQKFDKDGNLLGQYDYLEPNETVSDLGLSTDNTKIRTLARTPRFSSGTLPTNTDSLNISLNYSDADGRTLQSKRIKGSPNKKDLVLGSPVFDTFGRTQKSILPIATTSTNGSFESSVLTTAQSFYNDTSPFEEVTQYEASPISRSFKSIGAGQSFRPNKEGIQSLETGNFTLNKIIFDESGYYSIGTYSGNQISKVTNTNEQGNKVVTYSDKEGRTLENHVQFTGDGTSNSHYLKTTYVHDHLGRQVAIIPPLLYGQISNATNLLSSSYINYIYFVKFDSRGRAVEKHVPNGGWTYIVYNRLGQIVLSQNSRQRETNLWEWTKYGVRGQVVMTGIVTNSTYDRTNLQTQFDEFIDDKQYEERSTSFGSIEGYTQRSFPNYIQSLISNNDIKTVHYFDDYTWNANTQLNFQKYKTDRWTNSKGLLTGSKVRRLDTNAWLATTFYYDDKNRMIQSQSENRFGAINQTDMVMDFIGQLMENRAIYRKQASPILTIATRYNYDHAGRKLDATHYFNGRQELLATYEYDELGRAIRKNLNESRIDSIKRQNPVNDNYVTDIAKHFVLLKPGTSISGDSVYSAFIASGLQKVDFQYDVRGNLRCINCDSLGNLDSAKVFAMKLDFFQDGRFYNGLLSKQTWLTDSIQRSYLYDYDKANRYVTANFTGIGNEKYNENSQYDANGNILKLNRFGKTNSTTYGRIDSLNYVYPTNSNQLSGVSDLADITKGHKDNGNSTDYTYYSDGSIKTDNNKGITDITYNFLGLTDEIRFGATNKIKNLYTADGQKLAQLLIDGTDTTRTDYVGDLIYINGDLETVWMDEGRIKIKVDTTITTWLDTLTSIVYSDTSINFKSRYQYFIQDHLGNNRVIFEKLNDSLFVAQRLDYYPFGSPFASDSLEFKFSYQGKEYIDFLGLNQFDFHSRAYDSYLGRFNQIDGANQFASGYTGMGNNPVIGIDPDGQAVHIAAGAAIGGVINLVGQAIRGNVNSFKQGAMAFGMGAIAGALAAGTGGASLTYSQFILQSAVGQLPGANVNLGRGFNLSVSPSLMMGTQGFSLGANVGLGYSDDGYSIGLSTGLAYGKNSITGVKGWNGRIGGGVSVGGEEGYFSLSTMKYLSGETSQRTGSIGFGFYDFSVQYENDFHLKGLTSTYKLTDGGDRFRSAAMMIAYRDISAGFNLFTGDPGDTMENRPFETVDGHLTYIGDANHNPDKFRLGAAYVGYKNIRVGANSEKIRHVIQNRVAHDMLTKGEAKWFKILNNNWSAYGNVGTLNPFSLW